MCFSKSLSNCQGPRKISKTVAMQNDHNKVIGFADVTASRNLKHSEDGGTP